MAGAKAVRIASGETAATRLFDRIGAFLLDHRLAPTPDNYSIVYQFLTEEHGPVSRAVHPLIDGGARLTQQDIDTILRDVRPVDPGQSQTQGLVAQTQMQVEGFQDIVTAMRAETEDFGRDLAASAAAFSRSTDPGPQRAAPDDIARVTAAMLTRVRTAEARLETATREASELRQKLEEARDNARRDPLTELPNRRALEEAYAAQITAGNPVCLAICDVDHFKSVNDRFGHAVGDRVLKAISEALSRACKGHLVARFGGEEFAVLFSRIDIHDASEILDSARTIVAAKRYRLRDTDTPLGEITFSAGITAGQAGERFHRTFQRADRLLYAAKSAGRNCLRLD